MNDSDNNKPCCENTDTGLSCSCSPNGGECGKPVGRKALKAVICLVVLLAVAGTVAFRLVNTRGNNASATNVSGSFNFRGAAAETLAKESTTQAKQDLGDYLDSMSALSTVAANADVVLVLVPASGDASIDETSKTNIMKFQQNLTSSGVTAGLYTLSADSPDYPEIAKNYNLPIIYVARKGASAVTVPCSNVDEYKLMQAYQTCCGASTGCCH